jgi:hypothetical protein
MVGVSSMKPGDFVEIFPEFLDDDPNTTGIIIRESMWDDGYRSSGENGCDNWWVVLRGGKLVHHPIDTFRIVK